MRGSLASYHHRSPYAVCYKRFLSRISPRISFFFYSPSRLFAELFNATQLRNCHACSFRMWQVEGWEVGAVRGWEPRGQILWSNQEPVVHWHLLTGTVLYRWVYLRIFLSRAILSNFQKLLPFFRLSLHLLLFIADSLAIAEETWFLDVQTR